MQCDAAGHHYASDLQQRDLVRRCQTQSACMVLAWPASRAISSTGTPKLDIKDTKE
jgi:hypothetical protein